MVKEKMSSMVEYLRQVRNSLVFRQQLQSAVFLSDKILSLKHSTEDVFILAKCLYRLKEFQRAAYIITSKNLHHKDISCCLLVIKCYFKCKNYLEASELAKVALAKSYKLGSKSESWKVSILIMLGMLYQALDNQKSAIESLYKALEINFSCYEAFYMLTNQHMITKTKELDLLNSIIQNNKDGSPFLCSFIKFFYYIQLKKYDKPDELEIYSPFDIFSQNTDYLVAMVERQYYNCNYNQAIEMTTSLLSRDLYNLECLLIHVSCLIEFKRTNELFELSQKLIDLYPEKEISWYALGCYYHLIGKVDLARRFLFKATTLNSFFAPAWLLYGFSFSQESEHDQAISAYFKASHFMPGCHLPLLYIGVEYILTDNFKLGEMFISTASSIAPNDPLVLHELAVIKFNNNNIKGAYYNLRAALKILKYPLHGSALPKLPNRYDTLLNNIGHVLRKLERYPDAIEYHKKALMMSPQSASSYSAIGFIYCLMNKWNEAVEYLDIAAGLYRLLRHEDQNTKTMLESHALNQFANISRFNLGFTNKFNDPELVERLCNQSPLYFNLEESANLSDRKNDSSIMDITMDTTDASSSFRIL